jgi:hypothetical protein
MATVKNGAELVQKLKDSFTPDHLLEGARRFLARVFEQESRIATVEETFAAIEAEYAEHARATGREHGTVWKARIIMETGDVPTSTAGAVPPVEAMLLAKAEKDVVGGKAKADAAKPADAKATGQPDPAKNPAGSAATK